MVNKNCEGKVPIFIKSDIEKSPVYHTLCQAHDLLKKQRIHIDQQKFHEALNEIWKVVRDANRTIDDAAPWKLRKTDPDAMGNVLYMFLEIIRHLAILLQPFMPNSSNLMLDQISVGRDQRTFKYLHSGTQEIFDANSLKVKTKLPNPRGIFPRYVEETNQNTQEDK